MNMELQVGFLFLVSQILLAKRKKKCSMGYILWNCKGHLLVFKMFERVHF